MTREQIDNNRRRIEEELRGTKREGVEDLIRGLEKIGFFSASCKGHDEQEGGAANSALWALYIARKAREYTLRKHPEAPVAAEEDLILAVLGNSLIGNRIMADLVAAEQNAEAASGSDAPSLGEAVADAYRQAVGYADSIPFGAEQERPFRAVKEDRYIDIVLDVDDHRMWFGVDDHEGVFDGSEELSGFPVHHVLSVPVRPDADGKDMMVLFDDNAMYSLMVLSEDGGRGKENLYRSDKVIFGYTELEFYITRFPQYRSSYIAARNAKGMWGVFRVRENKKRNNDHRILLDRVVDFSWRSKEKALGNLRSHTALPILVSHPEFYSRITL